MSKYLGRFEARAGMDHTARKIQHAVEQIDYSFGPGFGETGNTDRLNIPLIAELKAKLKEASDLAAEASLMFSRADSTNLDDYLPGPNGEAPKVTPESAREVWEDKQRRMWTG